MFNLILTLIAIALFVVVLTYGFNYVDINKTVNNNKIQTLKADINKVSFIISKFKLEEEQNPVDFADLTSKGYMKSIANEDGGVDYIPAISIEGLTWPQANQIKFEGNDLLICFGGNQLDESNHNFLKKFNAKTIKVAVSQEQGYSGPEEYIYQETDNDRVIFADSCFKSQDEEITPSIIDGAKRYTIWTTYKISGDLL
jgi:hypothetical protein